MISILLATHFYKLPHIGPFSNVAQNRIRQLVNRYCNNLDIKLVFTSFEIRNLFSTKALIQSGCQAICRFQGSRPAAHSINRHDYISHPSYHTIQRSGLCECSEKTSHRPQLKNQDHHSARLHQQKTQRRR